MWQEIEAENQRPDNVNWDHLPTLVNRIADDYTHRVERDIPLTVRNALFELDDIGKNEADYTVKHIVNTMACAWTVLRASAQYLPYSDGMIRQHIRNIFELLSQTEEAKRAETAMKAYARAGVCPTYEEVFQNKMELRSYGRTSEY
jgi:hypothetical protein